MESEDGTGGRHPLFGDVDCHPPIPFNIYRQVTSVICLFHYNNIFNLNAEGYLYHAIIYQIPK